MEEKNKILLITLLFCLTNISFGQTQTQIDTILCYNNKNIIIEYPIINKTNIVNYEEGFFKTINCILDTASRWYGRILALMGIKNFEYKVQKNIEKLNALSPELAETISRLENSKTTYYILPITERSDYNVNSKKLNWNAYKNHIIYYDPDNIHGALGIRPPEAGLIHEMGHAENDDKGETIEYDAKAAIKGNTEEKDKWNKNEKHSIELENKVYESERINLKRDEKYIK